MTGDVDLFSHDRESMRSLVGLLPESARAVGVSITIVRDVGHLVRARVKANDMVTEVDVVYEPIADIESPPLPIEGIVVESLTDLRANKLTCILSRSEPRDLVDLCFLDRAGYPPDQDLELALRKDAGIDPGMLAWLLSKFPIHPLPKMLVPFEPGELRQYRDELAARLRGVTGF